MIDVKQLDKVFQRQPGSSLLGLAFDGGRLEGALVRRTNGSVEIKKTFTAALSLDLLTAEPELVGREIRKQLDAEGIRERWCAVALPLNWALTLTVKLPEIPEADVADFLQIESERGFPYGPEELMIAHSRFRASNGDLFATLVGIPREHITRLEAVLAAAQLRPVTLSLGFTAMQRADTDPANGVLAFLPGESSLGMQIVSGGGVVMLRTLDGAYEQTGASRELQVEHVGREIRIALGQLQQELRESVQRVRVFGRNEAAQELVEELQARIGSMGLKVEHVREYAAEEFGVKIPSGTAVSAAVSVAVRRLAAAEGMEFLPPKISAWQQFSQRYSSGKTAYAGMAAGAVAALIILAFFVQQIFIWHWETKWSRMEAKVKELEVIREDLRRYRPWYDDSVRTLSILRRVTQAFPADGAISAKSIELREPSKPGEATVITCTGTARNREALFHVTDDLQRATNQVSNLHIEYQRGSNPLEYSFNFQWGGAGQ